MKYAVCAICLLCTLSCSRSTESPENRSPAPAAAAIAPSLDPETAPIAKSATSPATTPGTMVLAIEEPSPSSGSQSEPASEKVPALRPVFSDDFSRDTRADYLIKGDVSWDGPGLMTLKEGAAIQRDIDGGPWAKVDVTLREVNLPADGQPAELRVWFLLDGATNCFVRLLSHPPDANGQTGSVALFDTGEQDGQPIVQMIREEPVKDSELRNLIIQYRHGLVEVTSADKPRLIAYISNSDAVLKGLGVELTFGSRTLTHLSVSASGPPAELTAEQQQQLAEASAANVELFSLYQHLDLTGAREVGERILQIRSSVLGNEHHLYAYSLQNLAMVYSQLGDHDRALTLCSKAADVIKTVVGEHHPRYASVLEVLASQYRDKGDLARALPQFQQASEIFRSALGERHSDYAKSLLNLAGICMQMSDYTRAEPILRQALDIQCSAIGTGHSDYASGLQMLAELYESKGDYVHAEALYKQAAEVQRATLGEEHPDYADALNNLALVYLRMDRYASAEPLLLQALEINKFALGEQHSEYATSLNNLSALYTRMGDFSRAEPRVKKSLAINYLRLGDHHTHYGAILLNLAQLYDSKGDPVSAQPLFGQALKIQRRSLERSSLVQSSRQQYLNQVVARFYLDNSVTNVVELESGPIGPLEDVWDWKGAVTARQRAYRQVARDLQLAPLFAELQSVTRQLSALCEQSPVSPPVTAAEAQRTSYEQKRRIWEHAFSTLSIQLEDLERRIATGSEAFHGIREPLTVTRVQQCLPPGTAFVDFLEYRHLLDKSGEKICSEYERRFIAVVVRPEQEAVMIGIVAAEALAEAIDVFRRPFVGGANSAANQEAAADAAEQLRRDLWLPIEAHLAGIDTVIISPDTALGTLPFAALPGKKDGTYLVEDYRIAMLPMANQLRELFESETEAPANNGLLVLGDVDYDSDAGSQESAAAEPVVADSAVRNEVGQLRSEHDHHWDSLPGFREELDSISELFAKQHPDESFTVLSGGQATEVDFLNQAHKYRTLHLITHGYFEDPNVKSINQADVSPEKLLTQFKGPDPFINTYLPGLLSGLAMAGANKPSEDPEDPHDGILRASEIEASSLQGVDLVVLSACETGLGAVAGGEGLTGLQRAFQVAGARTVVASLWKVDDRATQELMTQFYTNLWVKKQSKVDALRNAQLYLLRNPVLPDGTQLTRGDINKTKPVFPDPAENRDATDPYFWAAWTLSGDWR